MWNKILLFPFLLAAVLGAGALTGCDNDGPMENMGEEADETLDDAEDNLDN